MNLQVFRCVLRGLGLALGLFAGVAMAQTAQPVSRIVTLSPSLTEAVCALGHCAQLVGTDRHSTWPTSVLALPKVGGLEDAQIERIVTLRPNLVLLGPRSRAGERLQALGVPVMMLDARTHADLKRMLVKLGETLGEPARATELIARIDGELDAAASRMPAALRGRSVYVEVGAGASAASDKSFIGETVARLGLVNVVSGELGLFPKINPEALLRRPPDLIIGPRATLANLADRPGWSALPAVRQQQLCLLDTERMDLLSRPGPRLGEAAQMLVECLKALPPR
ncbi:helical backbone metal receptor [Rhodoferax saidenbachensis]|uniref:Iron complex transport system substrate-binding protein n=1 Tax=Rhodoferax saidenbachensis TaxID=1484693 RepID=A0ABU1ZIH8_9BURK|nr:helical backbone metal receptor [Rhodoferax saidenbachensis]MDR7305344.1 iron complex transport system substrate-binding protein [Rhodoferax saidenbachensis]